MPQITGIVYVKIDGMLMRSKEGAKLMLGGKERTPQVGYKLYGPSEKVIPSTVEFTIAHAAGDDLVGLSAKIDSTIEFDTDTGDSYLVANAFCTKPAELTGGEGDVAFAFMGDPAEPV